MLIRINSHSFALPRAGGLEVVFSERTRSGAYWGDRGWAPPLARPEDPAPLGGLLADALGAGLRALELLLLNLYLAVQVYLILFVIMYCAGAAPHLYLAVQVFPPPLAVGGDALAN